MSLRDFPNPMKELVQRYSKLKKNLPIIISNIAVNDFKENFRRQGYQSDTGSVIKWKKRKGNGGSRGVLTKSGRLRRSLRVSPRPGEARVVTNVPYAKIHNEGFHGVVSVKAHKRNTWKNAKVQGGGLTKNGKPRMKTVRIKARRYDVRSHKRKVNMPARPFMKTTKPLLNAIDKRVSEELNNLLK